MQINYFVAVAGALIFAGFLLLSIAFLTEGSRRAALIGLLLALTIPLPLFVFSISGNPVLNFLGTIITIATIICIILLVLPLKGKELRYIYNNLVSKDERDTIFSRKELKPGTSLYSAYYSKHPENEKKDNLWRAEPGLLSDNSMFYSKLAFSAAEASFDTVKLFASMRESNPEYAQSDLSGTDITNFIRSWGRKLGAVDVGFTEMKEYHYYIAAGRGDRYGKPILKEHPYGIVFLVEMDYDMISASPRAPVIMESANQYLRAAAVATQVAVMIRKLGYSAKTHIDANYDVICPLVAYDAGLGEIGRHGLLISGRHGPRVRISVVTTDIPLKTGHRLTDSSIVKFCSACKKCAFNCPSQSIPSGPMEIRDGVMKWHVNQESCFTYWNHCGTDCGRCLSTCPYSHRSNWFHNMIRRGIRNNIFFLHLSRVLDDLFYGRRPSAGKLKDLDP